MFALILRTAALAASVLFFPSAALSETLANGVQFNCYHGSYMGQSAASCVLGFPVIGFVQATYDTQHENEWCWAASLEMALKAEGYRVPQEQIVEAAYGAPVDWSASVATIEDVANALTRDADGNSIDVVLKDWHDDDPSSQIHHITGAFSRGHPVLLALPTHVVVLSGFQYFGTGADGQDDVFGNGRVSDPWPPGLDSAPGGSRVMPASEYASVEHVWEVIVH